MERQRHKPYHPLKKGEETLLQNPKLLSPTGTVQMMLEIPRTGAWPEKSMQRWYQRCTHSPCMFVDFFKGFESLNIPDSSVPQFTLPEYLK